MKQWPWLDEYPDCWPIDDIIRTNYSNANGYKHDKMAGKYSAWKANTNRTPHAHTRQASTEDSNRDEEESNQDFENWGWNAAGELGNDKDSSPLSSEDEAPVVHKKRGRKRRIMEDDDNDGAITGSADQDNQDCTESDNNLDPMEQQNEVNHNAINGASELALNKPTSNPTRATAPPSTVSADALSIDDFLAEAKRHGLVISGKYYSISTPLFLYSPSDLFIR